MSTGHFLRSLDLTVTNGTTKSNIIRASALQGHWAAMLYSPAAIGTAGTVTIQVNPDPAAVDASSFWCTLQQNGADVAVGAVNKAFALSELATVGAFRLSCSDPGTNVTWKLTQNVT